MCIVNFNVNIKLTKREKSIICITIFSELKYIHKISIAPNNNRYVLDEVMKFLCKFIPDHSHKNVRLLEMLPIKTHLTRD